ncbi:hypothetical protein [Streptomyces kaempferi]|uniref:Uncharacterized protein n=1 Tax=Streptomyces kaempferi TaxID=333725 RepID=A0ABW3XHF2_9ACTN
MIADTVGWLADHWLLALWIWIGSSLACALLWAAACELARHASRHNQPRKEKP